MASSFSSSYLALLLVLSCAASGVATDTPGDLPDIPDTVEPGPACPSDLPADPGASGLAPHGSGCTVNEDCTGGMCATTEIHASFAGGYCTAFCDPDALCSCGQGAYCVVLDFLPPLCAKSCASDSDCRAPDYVCIGTCVPALFIAKVDMPGKVTGGEEEIGALVASIDTARVMATVRVLAGEDPWASPDGERFIRSRSVSHPDHAPAVAYITARLEGMGIEVEPLPFSKPGMAMTNIEARIAGIDGSLGPALVVAHFDSTALSTPGWKADTDPAPGAGDNASGVAIALEIATVMTSPGFPPPRRPVRIVLFDGEEKGLLGSTQYAPGLVQDKPACVLNIDMVGAAHPAMGGRFWYQFDSASTPFAALGMEAVGAFVPSSMPVMTRFTQGDGSDSAPFWKQKTCSVAMVAWPRMPYNHTVKDLPAEFQIEFYAGVARSAAAVIGAWAYLE